MQSRQRAFTLVELLVVISIIAILAGLALPAIGGAMNTAKKAKANSMINQLKVAITAFNTEYGTWPNPGGTETSDNTLDIPTAYAVLVGPSSGSLQSKSEGAGNTRDIPFMEFNVQDLDNSSNPTMFVDPWYRTSKDKADQNYSILLDYDYNNQLSVPDVTQTSGSTSLSSGSLLINAGVAIGDPGPPLSKDGTSSGTNVNVNYPSKMLHSW